MKRLIFCFDGTWNRLNAGTPTNVVSTAASILRQAPGGITLDDDAWRCEKVAGYTAGTAPTMTIKYLGIWDRVGALGLPKVMPLSGMLNCKHRFHDTSLTDFVESARHAVAIDERRSLFPSEPWGDLTAINLAKGFTPNASNAPYQEKRFPGAHGSVGGGGDIRGLSDGALTWVLKGAKLAGLKLDDEQGSRIQKFLPDALAPLVNISAPGFNLTGTIKTDRSGPKHLWQVSVSAIRRWHAPANALPNNKPYRPKTLAHVAADLGKSPVGAPTRATSIVHTVMAKDALRKVARNYLGDAGQSDAIFRDSGPSRRSGGNLWGAEAAHPRNKHIPSHRRTCEMKLWRLAVATSLGLFFSASAVAADGELHTFHCLFGCPLGAPATNDTVVREIYTLSSNDLTKLADWVAYRVTPETIGSSESRDWKADPWLAANETLTPKNYDQASGALHVDRGHQAPLASFSGTPFAAETNTLSNITPQSSALNQGPWVKIEDQERALAKRLNTGVYVLTGPLFERLMKPLPKATALHRVPSGYWKVIALADGRSTSFIFDQASSRKQDYCTARASLTELQLRSRLLVFPMAAKPLTGALDNELGCQGQMPLPAPLSEIPAETRTQGPR